MSRLANWNVHKIVIFGARAYGYTAAVLGCARPVCIGNELIACYHELDPLMWNDQAVATGLFIWFGDNWRLLSTASYFGRQSSLFLAQGNSRGIKKDKKKDESFLERLSSCPMSIHLAIWTIIFLVFDQTNSC